MEGDVSHNLDGIKGLAQQVTELSQWRYNFFDMKVGEHPLVITPNYPNVHVDNLIARCLAFAALYGPNHNQAEEVDRLASALFEIVEGTSKLTSNDLEDLIRDAFASMDYGAAWGFKG